MRNIKAKNHIDDSRRKGYLSGIKVFFSKLISNIIFKNIMVLILSVFLSFGSLTTPVLANPQGGQVTSGTVTIQQSPNSTVINQSSPQAIINWNSFNIGAQESTHFQQPVGGIALNRISASDGPLLSMDDSLQQDKLF